LKCWGTLSFESVPSKSLYSVFKGNVYFSAASFYSDLRLAGTNFEKNLIFRGALFNGFVFTNDMGLPDTLDFSQVQRVEKRIDFTQGKLQPGKRFCYINLTGSDVSKVRLNYDIFRLTFDLDASDGDKCSVYEGLLSNFEQDGFAQSYKILDIEYYKYKYERDEKWFINWLQKWWWNYGYNKEKIFPNSLILLVCFFLSNLLISLIKGPEFLMRDVYYVERLWEMVERIKEKTPGRLEYVRGYLPYLFIYTVMIFFVLNLNIKYLKYSSKIGLAWVMFTFIVGLACAAYIVNFVLDK
jgi:hypothetical protein